MNDRRRIVVVVPDFEPTLGGTTRQTRNLANAFAAKGFSVTVVTQRLDPAWAAHEVAAGIDIVRLGPSRRTGTGMKQLVANVAWWLGRQRDSIAVVVSIMYPDFVVAAHFAGLADRAVMVWAGMGDATDTLTAGRRGPRNALARTRRAALRHGVSIALSQSIADELDGLALDAPIRVVPTPVDRSRFRPPAPHERLSARAALGLTDSTLAVVYAGHLRELKRVDHLLRAFRGLVDADVDTRLFVLGGSRADLEDRSAALQALTARLDLGALVTFTGEIDDVVPYLHAADTFVLPSDREGVSNSLIEALACGVPCIAPASAGGDEVLDPHSGIVPASNSPADLTRALLRVADPVERARLQSGTAFAARRFGLDEVADEYLWIFEDLLARHIG